MKRPYGSGQIYEKSGAYYARWRTPDGRRMNRKLGPKRAKGGSDGLTRAQAEQAFRRLQAEEATKRPVEPVVEIVTVDQAAERLRERIAIEGARLSYRENCESMQRIHISSAIGKRKVASIRSEDVERLASTMLAKGSSPKTVRNVMTFLSSVFELAVKKGWAPANPVADAARPRRRRHGDADPDLQYLTLPELDAVIEAIPDVTVDRDALRIDSTTSRLERVIEIPAGVDGPLAVGEGALWVLSRDPDLAVTPVNPDSSAVGRSIRVGDYVLEPAEGLAVGGGSVWVGDPETGAVHRIDPRRRRLVPTSLTLEAGAYALAYSDGALWALAGDGKVTRRIDPDAATPSGQPVPVDVARSARLALSADAAWVTDAERSSLLRLGY